MQEKAPQYINSHAHLTSDDYKEDLDSVLSRAKDAGVEYVIVPGINLKSSREAIRLSEQYERIYACVGVHPHEASKAADRDLTEIEELSKHPKVVAIGEIGLDYHYDFSPRDCQREFFSSQMEIAACRNLPVVVHTRESIKDAFDIVQQAVNIHPDWKGGREEPLRGVFHCFPGTAEQSAFVRKLGFYVSYPGIVTFKKSESIDIVKQIGIQNLLLETDSPYMTPVPLRGKRNEPANIIFIGRKIAEALNIPEADVARITTQNAMCVFSLPMSEL